MTDKVLSIAEAAKVTGLSREWLHKLCRDGRIPGAGQIGPSYFIPAEWAEREAAIRAASVTAVDAAKLAGVTAASIHQAARAGKLQTTTAGRITRNSLRQYVGGRDEKKKEDVQMTEREQIAYNYGRVLGLVEVAAPGAVTPKLYADYMERPGRWLAELLTRYRAAHNAEYENMLTEYMAALAPDAEGLRFEAAEQTALIVGEYHAKRDLGQAEG